MKNLEKLFIDLSIVAASIKVIGPFLGNFDKIFGTMSTVMVLILAVLVFGGLFFIGKKNNDKLLSIAIMLFIPVSALTDTFLPNLVLLNILGVILFILIGWRLWYIYYGGYLSKLTSLVIMLDGITYLLIGMEPKNLHYIVDLLLLGILLSYRFNYKPKIKKFW